MTALTLSLASKNRRGCHASYEFDEDVLGIADQYYQHYVAAEQEHEKQMFNHLDSVGQIDQVHSVRPKQTPEAIECAESCLAVGHDIERSDQEKEVAGSVSKTPMRFNTPFESDHNREEEDKDSSAESSR